MGILTKALIVGIDPGSTIGLCIIDTLGESKGVFSFKSPRAHNVVNKILEYGTPVVISCDKKKPPEYINKLSARLGCRVISPPRDLLISEKKRLVIKNKCSAVVKDSHQRDACAGAYYAFSRMKSSIKKIEESFSSEELSAPLFKKILVEGKTINDTRKDLWKEKTKKTQYTNKKSFIAKSLSKKNANTRSDLALPNKLADKIYSLKEEIRKLKRENEKIFLRVKELESDIDTKAMALANERLKKVTSEKRLLSRINLQISDSNLKEKKKIEILEEQIARLKDKLNNDDFWRTVIFLRGSRIRLKEIFMFRNQKVFIKEIDFLKDFAIRAFKDQNISVFYDEAPKIEVTRLRDNGIQSLKVLNAKREEILGYAFFDKRDIKILMERNDFLKEIIEDYKLKRKGACIK